MNANRAREAGALGLSALLGLALAGEGQTLSRLEFLGQAALPAGLRYQGAPVGGLSGISWDATTGLYFVVSDDRAERGPARAYTFSIDLADGRLADGDLAITSLIQLLDRGRDSFATGRVDAEGIAVARDGALYVTSEGNASDGVDPFIRRYDRDGSVSQDFDLPRRFRPRGDGNSGIYHNQGFESAALTPDGAFLFTATENALIQDGDQADVGIASPARIVKLDVARGKIVADYLYWVDPVSGPPEPSDGLRTRGISELLALDEQTLLALEREYVAGVGHRIMLYRVDLSTADNVEARFEVAPKSVRAAGKELLFNFAELGLPLDNFEGMTFGPTLADGRRTLIVVSDDNFSAEQKNLVLAFGVGLEPLTVAAVQGPGHRSPMENSWLLDLPGQVTATEDSRNRRGFWLASPQPDRDVATADGVFVEVATAQLPAPGDSVRVRGRVSEPAAAGELATTRVVATSWTTGSRGNPPPRAVVLGRGGRPVPSGAIDDDGLASFDPESDAIDFFESLEGVRVEVPNPVVVGPTSSFGGFVVLADGGEGASLRTRRGGILLRGDDVNPERIAVETSLLGKVPRVAVGDRFSGSITGILDYRFGGYVLLATEPLPGALTAAPIRDSSALRPGPEHLTIATYNVLNLSAKDDDPRFARLAQTIVQDLGGPDVLALQEVQDDSGPADDGVVDAAATFTRLITAIGAAGGPKYLFRQINPENNADGGQPGGNIRVGFLYNPARVVFMDRGNAGPRDAVALVPEADGPRLSHSPGRVVPRDPAFAFGEDGKVEGVRKSLAAEILFQGNRLFIVNNHLTSKRGDDRLFGSRQPARLGSEPVRTAQTRALRGFVDRLLAADALANVIVLGDMNEHEFRPPLAELTQHQAGRLGLTNMMEWVSVDDRYSFNFQGNSQLLDHVLLSPNLVVNAAPEVDVVHVNVDLPEDTAASDHDPVIVRLRIPAR